MDHHNQTITLESGRRIGFAEWGDLGGKPVLVFVGGSSRLVCHPDESIARDLGLRLLTLDRPGLGESDYVPGRTLLSWADDLRTIIDQLGLTTIAVLGVSHGGATAAACAYRMPARVRSLTLVSSLAPYDEAPLKGTTNRLGKIVKHLPVLLYGTHGLAWLMVHANANWTMRQVVAGLPALDRVMFSANPDLVTMFANGLKADYQQGVRGVVHEGRLGYEAWGFSLDQIQTSTFIWQGEQDTTIDPQVGRFLAARIPNSTLTMVPDAGHMLGFTLWRSILAQIAATL